jgi:quercetin dioxygenase-like cupin family protein
MSAFPDPAIGGTDGQAYRFLDTLAYVRIPGTATDGRLSVVELHMREGHVTPLHVHEDADETFHVLSGALTAHRPDGATTVEAGESVVLPRGEPHAVTVDREARAIVTTAPAGFDEFVTAVGEPTDDETVPTEPPSEAAIGRVEELGPDHGISIRGPPPEP